MRGSTPPLNPDPPPTSRIGIDCPVFPSTRRGTCAGAACAGAASSPNAVASVPLAPYVSNRRRLSSFESSMRHLVLRDQPRARTDRARTAHEPRTSLGTREAKKDVALEHAMCKRRADLFFDLPRSLS